MKRILIEYSNSIEYDVWINVWGLVLCLNPLLSIKVEHYENKYNIKQYIKQTLNYSKDIK